jgi:hypothetical protein
MTDTPEDIVRALGGLKHAPDSEGWCAFCSAPCDKPHWEHEIDCPWRRAVEWVEANPK